jgi:2-succinyl-6-hydroxy-2,4-cyclohexadiene-1-carboxylate synthase
MRPIALHVERRGHGAALVLLHGFAGSGRDMAALANALDSEYATIVPDLPGHGRSVDAAAGGVFDFDDALDSLAAVLDAAALSRAHWLGYSMGARLALAFAARCPERVTSLVLLAGRAGIADADERHARRRADEALAARIETNGVEAFVDEWLAQPLFDALRRRGPEALRKARLARLGNDAAGLAAALRALGPGAQPPVFDALARLDLPVLLVAGGLDPRFVELGRDLAARLPRAELRVIPDAGHAAHVEQPEAFDRVVREFLRRVDGPARPSLHPVQETVP